MIDTPQEAAIGDKAAKELMAHKCRILRAANKMLFAALDQVSMHAKATFTDDDAVMNSWVRCMDLVDLTLEKTRSQA